MEKPPLRVLDISVSILRVLRT